MKIEAIKAVAKLRSQLAIVKEAKQESYDKWLKTNSLLISSVEIATKYLQEAEDAIRLEAIEEYKLCPSNKAIAPGVTIKIFDILEYEPGKALDWALEHKLALKLDTPKLEHKLALKLDTPKFEKLAKISPPDFVGIGQEPRCQIAGDLEKVLEELRPTFQE